MQCQTRLVLDKSTAKLWPWFLVAPCYLIEVGDRRFDLVGKGLALIGRRLV